MSNSQRNGHTQPPGHVDQTERATEHVLDKHSVKKFLKLLVEGKTKNDEVFTLSPRKNIVAIHRKPTTPDDHQTEFFCMQSPNNNCDELVEMIEKHAPASSMRRIVLLYQPVIPQIKDGQYTIQEIEHSQLHAQSYVSGNASFVKSVIIPYLPRLEHIVDFTLSDSDMAEFRKLTVESVRGKVINLYAKLEDTWESDYQSFELWFEGYTFALNGMGIQNLPCRVSEGSEGSAGDVQGTCAEVHIKHCK
ncbi:hypothetical protein JR316_0002820 [Psilocybe cubensis]|uniref:Uncharacterized protein n=2 Tax=Psilocybe cubensis TaxID=181762 RepID=A0A8H7Y5V4_PSICU|nr:hypothetical protein JR316_0002820 [Psilocybe cubensis]KAH9485903.1 hypothetical protein JR316_0002820 [Psilocybe cubensis]